MHVPNDRCYTADHEWLRLDGAEAVLGITEFAQDQLGDVVYVELPAVGTPITKGEPFGVVESVKAVSDLFAPVSGVVVAQNARLAERPELVNASPYDEAWLIRITLRDPADVEALLDAAAYRALVEAG